LRAHSLEVAIVPVRYAPPTPESLLPVPGVALGAAAGKVKKWDRNDVLLAVCDPGTVAAGVFTQNRFCAAPVTVCREHLARQSGFRALIVNAGNANAGTGDAGLADAHAECVAVARLLECAPEEVLVYSTGVIMEPLRSTAFSAHCLRRAARRAGTAGSPPPRRS
jgi:glutamate N-acetyltransferase/amino-acid N-acetyltransferase